MGNYNILFPINIKIASVNKTNNQIALFMYMHKRHTHNIQPLRYIILYNTVYIIYIA